MANDKIKRETKKVKRYSNDVLRTLESEVFQPLRDTKRYKVAKNITKAAKSSIDNKADFAKNLIRRESLSSSFEIYKQTSATNKKKLRNALRTSLDLPSTGGQFVSSAAKTVSSKYNKIINNDAINQIAPFTVNAVKGAVAIGKGSYNLAKKVAHPKQTYNEFKEDASEFIQNIPEKLKEGVKGGLSTVGNFIADNTYRPVVDTLQAGAQAFVESGATVVRTLDRGAKAVGKAYNKTKGAVKSGIAAGKRAAKFVKSHGGIKGTAKHAAQKVADRTKKFNSNLKRLPTKLKDGTKEFAVNSLHSLRRNVRVAAIRKYQETQNSIVDFILNNKRKIKFAIMSSATILVIGALVTTLVAVSGLAQLPGKTPHYYCDTDNPPAAIKDTAAYRLYCKAGKDNSGIAEAALSLVDPYYLATGVSSGSLGSGISDMYRDAMDYFRDMVTWTDDGFPTPYANCIGFTTTVLAFAGVEEEDICRNSPCDCVSKMQQSDAWEEVSPDDIQPGDVLMSDNAADFGGLSHTYIYTGTELMQEFYPELPSDYDLCEASYMDYGGTTTTSTNGPWHDYANPAFHIFRYTKELNPRDLP